MGLFSCFISICLWAWSSITHYHHVYYWIGLGFTTLGFLGAGFVTWTRYHDPNTPYK